MHSGRTIFRECHRRQLISDITASKPAARTHPGYSEMIRGTITSLTDSSLILRRITPLNLPDISVHHPLPPSPLNRSSRAAMQRPSSAVLLSVVAFLVSSHAHTSRPPHPDIFLDPRICPPKRVPTTESGPLLSPPNRLWPDISSFSLPSPRNFSSSALAPYTATHQPRITPGSPANLRSDALSIAAHAADALSSKRSSLDLSFFGGSEHNSIDSIQQK